MGRQSTLFNLFADSESERTHPVVEHLLYNSTLAHEEVEQLVLGAIRDGALEGHELQRRRLIGSAFGLVK